MISKKRLSVKAKKLLSQLYGDFSEEEEDDNQEGEELEEEDKEQENISLIGGQKRIFRTMSSSAAARRKLYSSNEEVNEAFVGALHPEKLFYPVIVGHSRENYSRFKFPKNETITTKYNVVTFIPRFLFEQYKKATNIFFLIVVMINLMPGVLAVNPFTTLFPVIFVLTIGAIRELVEDIRRRIADRVVNQELFEVSQNGNPFVPVRCENIRVGDLVRLRKDQRIPADIVLLSSSLPDGLCYLETAQLDGETNLKAYHANTTTNSLDEQTLSNTEMTLIAERPSPVMHRFQGRLVIFKKNSGLHKRKARSVAIDENSLLLQGAILRNTEAAVGAVLYTGSFTKLSRNQKKPPSKFSRADRILNRFIFSLMALIAVMVALACGLSALFLSKSHSYWYLWGDNNNGPTTNPTLRATLAYFVVTSYFIPMSIAITLELVRMFQAFMINFDDRMTHEIDIGGGTKKRVGAVAKTSSLNDDLSLVRYVFSDKTGTLTENVMQFHSCSVNGVLYSKPLSGELADALKEEAQGTPSQAKECDWNKKCIREFLSCLAVCNSVVPSPNDSEEDITFLAESPDEEALCTAARANGFCLFSRQQKSVTVRRADGTLDEYHILASIPFSSERRRMSVLVKRPDGTAVLYTKGADNVMLPRLGEDKRDKEAIPLLKKHISGYCSKGLRVLVMTEREIPEHQLKQWLQEYENASKVIGSRKECVAAAFDSLESHMQLLGCTAVEDKLQEGVPQSIASLLRAGVQVWMITGDKQETAVNIGRSCSLVNDDAALVVLGSEVTEANCNECLRSALEQANTVNHESFSNQHVLVMTGSAVRHVICSDFESRTKQFMRIVRSVNAVICCQMTPMQKAEVVQCIQSFTGAVCVAVGDGANDVTMIQTADVGIGVFGREGTQAVRSADYAVRQFRDLVPLLTVHGRYSMVRTAVCVKYSFFKNVAFIMLQYAYGFFNMFSGRTVYDDVVVMLFNTTLSSLPPFFLGAFEKDIPEYLLLRNPELYRRMQLGSHFRVKDILVWILYGFYQVFVFTIILSCVLSPGSLASGLPGVQSVALGTLSAWATCIALTSLLVVGALITRHWVVWTHVGIAFSALSYIIQWGITSASSPSSVLFGTFASTLSTPLFYLTLIGTLALALAPLLIVMCYRTFWKPDESIICNELDSLSKKGKTIIH